MNLNTPQQYLQVKARLAPCVHGVEVASQRNEALNAADAPARLQDLSDPLLVMFELPEDEGEGEEEGNTFEVTEAIPDVELFNYKANTRSIHVLSGA